MALFINEDGKQLTKKQIIVPDKLVKKLIKVSLVNIKTPKVLNVLVRLLMMIITNVLTKKTVFILKTKQYRFPI